MAVSGIASHIQGQTSALVTGGKAGLRLVVVHLAQHALRHPLHGREVHATVKVIVQIRSHIPIFGHTFFLKCQTSIDAPITVHVLRTVGVHSGFGIVAEPLCHVVHPKPGIHVHLCKPLFLRAAVQEFRAEVIPPTVLQVRIPHTYMQGIGSIADRQTVHKVGRAQSHVGIDRERPEISCTSKPIDQISEIGLDTEHATLQAGIYLLPAVAHVFLRLCERQMEIEPDVFVLRPPGIESAQP